MTPKSQKIIIFPLIQPFMMIDRVLTELDNDLTAIVYDLIYNHSVLSSLNLSWDSFDVYPPEVDNGKNLENGEKYRRFRSNLHSLIISSAALVENLLMRMYLVTNIGFTQENYETKGQVAKLEGMLCADEGSRICNLIKEAKHISEVIFLIKTEFAHSSKTEMSDVGISNVKISYDPENELELTRTEIKLTLNQFLEQIMRMLHLLLDLIEEVDRHEDKYNSIPLKNISRRFVSGFTHAKLELRRSAISVSPKWLEFENRIKDLIYF